MSFTFWLLAFKPLTQQNNFPFKVTVFVHPFYEEKKNTCMSFFKNKSKHRVDSLSSQASILHWEANVANHFFCVLPEFLFASTHMFTCASPFSLSAQTRHTTALAIFTGPQALDLGIHNLLHYFVKSWIVSHCMKVL